MALMQCAGNRRADLHRLRPVTGDPWEAGAIGNAGWTGVSLADVLRAAEADLDPALHIAFESADTVNGQPYGVSIPMTKALCPDVLLAFEMNGELLAPEHGFPLRVVEPTISTVSPAGMPQKTAGFYGRSRFVVLKITPLSEDISH